MTEHVYHMNDLMERASRGDDQAQQELNKQMQWLEYMTGTLQAWTASGQISNSVGKHQLALNWRKAAQNHYGLERYFSQKGEMENARFHKERANEFKQGAEELPD